MEFEANIIRFLQNETSLGFIKFAQFITIFGSTIGVIFTFAILFIKNRKLSLCFLATFLVATVCNSLLKHIILRDRPFVKYDDIINYGQEDGYSMPSGHSVGAGFFATFLFFSILLSTKHKGLRSLGFICCYLGAICIAVSRMVLGVHYLTDTIAGLCEGVIFAVIGICFYKSLCTMNTKHKDIKNDNNKN